MINYLFSFVFVSLLAPMQTGKDEFVFNNGTEVETLDPHLATGVPEANILAQTFEGLMARKSDWVTLVPGQAESYTVSNNLKTYTFKLRKNLKWSDGSPLTAKDFEYGLLRAMLPQFAYSYWLTDNIIGAKEYAKNPTKDNAKKVLVKALDGRTLLIQLNKPVPYFLHLVAEPITFPVKKEVVEKYGDQWARPEHMLSNGPYKMVEWKVQQRIVLEKNNHYYDATGVSLRKVVALPIEDRQTGVNLFRQGKLDWSGSNGVPNALVPSFVKDPHFRLHPAFSVSFYRFNITRPPLNDVRVRQALALAINRKQLVEKVIRGGEVATDFFVPPKTGVYQSPKGLTSDDFKADVQKAQQLLAAAGFPGGKGMRPLNLLYNTLETHKKVAQAITAMWKENLHIEVRPYNQEWKVYLQSQQSLDFDISRSAWMGDYPDPATFLELFQSTSQNNNTGWKNATYDKLFEEANQMSAGEARNKKLAEVEVILLEAAPIIPLYLAPNYSFLRPEIVGFELNLVDRPFIRYISKK